jgi:hypothetical protein
MKAGATEKKKLIPLLYWDPEKDAYRFGCTCLKCPCNLGGVCGSVNQPPLKDWFFLMHEFDGDNIIKQVCG